MHGIYKTESGWSDWCRIRRDDCNFRQTGIIIFQLVNWGLVQPCIINSEFCTRYLCQLHVSNPRRSPLRRRLVAAHLMQILSTLFTVNYARLYEAFMGLSGNNFFAKYLAVVSNQLQHILWPNRYFPTTPAMTTNALSPICFLPWLKKFSAL